MDFLEFFSSEISLIFNLSFNNSNNLKKFKSYDIIHHKYLLLNAPNVNHFLLISHLIRIKNF